MEPEPTALPFAAEQDEIRALYTIYVSLCSLSPRGPRPDPRATLRIAVRETHRGDSWFLDKENARTAEIVGGWYGGASGRESWNQPCLSGLDPHGARAAEGKRRAVPVGMFPRWGRVMTRRSLTLATGDASARAEAEQASSDARETLAAARAL